MENASQGKIKEHNKMETVVSIDRVQGQELLEVSKVPEMSGIISVGQAVDQSTGGLWSDVDIGVLFAASWLDIEVELLRAWSLRFRAHIRTLWFDRNSSEGARTDDVDNRTACWNCRDLATDSCCMSNGL